MDTYPRISVIVPTCNRPDDVRRVLDSLTAVEYPCWDLIVVDQSDDARTEAIVDRAKPLLPNLRHYRLDRKRCSHARNVGIRETDGEIIAFVDDDCTVRSDWLTQVARTFGRHPQAALVVGDLRPPDGVAEWSAEGWTPIRHFPVEFEANVIGSLRQRLRIWDELVGNGACMFLRRWLVERIGFFDEELGGGGRIPANEDGDYIYRAFMAGCSVVGTPAIVVDHYGIREYKSGAAARLIGSYHYSKGAWLMKVLRLGDPCALIWILREYRAAVTYINFGNIFGRQGSKGLVALDMFTRGLIESFALRVDRKSKLFALRNAE